MRVARCAVLAILVMGIAWGADWQIARPDYAWSFPEDHWARPGYKTEWWYFTGHLSTETGRRFGYQFTFFRVGLLPEKPEWDSEWAAEDLIMGHASVSDLTTGRHVFSELVYRAVPLLGGFGSFPDSTIAWSRAPTGTDGDWRLRWNGSAFDFHAQDDVKGMALTLSTAPTKPLVFQGPSGYSRKGEGATSASQYYSFTRLHTAGQVTLDGEVFEVTGESWMDKEFGSNQLSDDQVGWDWFSLQLDGSWELMLYLLRTASGEVSFARGTLVSESGEARYLDSDAFEVRSTETWTSGATGATYPSRWDVKVPSEGILLRVVPEVADQENRSRLVPGLHYWEGAVRAERDDGTEAGRGYAELVGYGTTQRLGI